MAISNSFNIGNDVRLVFIGAFGRVDFTHVTGWSSKPINKAGGNNRAALSLANPQEHSRRLGFPF